MKDIYYGSYGAAILINHTIRLRNQIIMSEKYYQSSIGILKIISTEKQLLEVRFVDQSKKYSLSFPDDLINKTLNQIDEYRNGTRQSFDLPIVEPKTEFSKKVVEAVLNIPYGQFSSYKEIAEKINSPKAMRAIGMAHTKNPYQIIIPFHRLVKQDKKTGSIIYNDSIQQILLNIENL